MHRSTTFRRLLTSSLLVLALSCAGCGTNLFQRRTVYVPPGEPVRLREPVKNVKVWVYVPEKKAWEPSTITIPEGWYALAKKKTEGQ